MRRGRFMMICSRRCRITGMIVTKLDGSAKGGVVIALAEQYGIPVHAVGVGEGADDLQPFEARDFANALAGVPASG